MNHPVNHPDFGDSKSKMRADSSLSFSSGRTILIAIDIAEREVVEREYNSSVVYPPMVNKLRQASMGNR